MNDLPFGFELEVLPDLSGFVGEHVLKLLFLLAKHLHFALRKLNLLVHLADHFLSHAPQVSNTALKSHGAVFAYLETAKLSLQAALGGHLVASAHVRLRCETELLSAHLGSCRCTNGSW